MKMTIVVAGVCGAAAIIVAAAQNQEPARGGPASRLAAAIDADRDGAISAAELRLAPAALKTLDTNGDGIVSAEEWRPAFGPGARDGGSGFGGRRGRGGEEGRGGASQASAEELADTLMAFDKNSDGHLDRAEVPERFQGLFDRADGNKDGVLTRDELKESATASATAQQDAGGRRGGREGAGFGREGGRGRGGPMGDPLMRALDADGDGALSTAELTRATEALRVLDTNQDGALSGDEIRPAPRGPFGGREGRRQ